MKKKIVIIGGVAGGATAAARLRRLSEEIEIVMFEKDEYIAFANCGLPYYIGGVIEERDKLLVQTVEGLGSRYNLDIRNLSEVTKINREKKTVEVLNHRDNTVYEESYDELIYSPGASPIVPPFPSVRNANNVFTVRNIPDVDNIKGYITDEVKNCVVIGAGFIGVEMAENLAHLGKNVTLIDLQKTILSQFDEEMVASLELELKNNGVNVLTSTSVSDVTTNYVELSDGQKIDTDMTILAIGVAPTSKLAKDANLDVDKRGAVIVDSSFRTSDKSIYAVGDVISSTCYLTNDRVNIPLAGPANRQARVVADIICGREFDYKGIIGTSVLKVFDLTAASTGLNEAKLKAANLDYDSVIVHRANHASYYPGSSTVSLKLLFNKETKEIYGAQAIGMSGVEKRIDVIATAIKGKMTIVDLEELELSYAPPFSSAKDPVNIAGYAACNLSSGEKFFTYKEVEEIKNELLIDVRTELEYELGHIEGSINIDLDTLRTASLPEDKSTKIYLYCQVGLRGYVAQRILVNMGYTNVYNLSGGYTTYNNYLKNQKSTKSNITLDSGETTMNATKSINAVGLQCPGPIMEVYKNVEAMNDGEILEITVSDVGFCEDIKSWCDKCNNELLSLIKNSDSTYTAKIRKGSGGGSCSVNFDANTGTIVMFSGDLDKALATMIIAQGAAASGKQMTVFFTFWGLNVLRKSEHVKVKKTMFEKMFGFMMPRGAKKLGLSSMNMMGMGSAMIKGRMKDKNVEMLPEMIKKAQEVGVKFIACTMSMDLMGIKEEELIDGVELGGVAKYVGDSTGSDLTLFI